jgi:hypothetical protein
MLRTPQLLRSLLLILITIVAQSLQFLRWALSSRAALSAEVLFLRKQLAFYQEHQISPRKLTAAARFSLLLWSRFFHWREALMIVKPETLIGSHRKGFKLWWWTKSQLGRSRLPHDLRQWIVRMVRENPTWGEERVAGELVATENASTVRQVIIVMTLSTINAAILNGGERCWCPDNNIPAN